MSEKGQWDLFGEPPPPPPKHKPTQEELAEEARRLAEEQEQYRAEREAQRQKRSRVPYDARPGTQLNMKEYGNNVWIEVRGQKKPRATYDPDERVFQRGTSLERFTWAGSLAFNQDEVSFIRKKHPRLIEHIDLDHDDWDDFRCYRTTFERFRGLGFWTSTRLGDRWLVPLWAWDVVRPDASIETEGRDEQ
jgi:hypothetical protein